MDLRFAAGLICGLTLVAIAVNGYHPYTEDGGLYLAAARHLLDPALYPHDVALVIEPSRFSIFAPVLAGAARLTKFPHTTGLAVIAFALHLVTVWATLGAAWLVACRCWPGRAARSGAVLLMACWAGLPIAGTSLLLMDPYLTARSFATPCLLLALLGVLMSTAGEEEEQQPEDRKHGPLIWLASIIAGTTMHPLMAAYTVGASVLLAWVRVSRGRARWLGLAAIGAAAWISASVLALFAPAEAPGYTQIALTRTYWFVGSWRWFELAGIAGPLLIAVFFAQPRHGGDGDAQSGAAAALAVASAAAAVLATAVATVFARERGPDYLIARLQPMRELEFVYLAMLLLLGSWLGRHVLRGSRKRWIAAGLLLSAPMYFADRRTTPQSAHLELPWRTPANLWVRAFVWIRENTPKDALFALYPDYVQAHGEDAQSFRAIAERSVLADYSKDGGEASIAPELTAAWVEGQAAQQGLVTEDDAARRAKLEPLGVSWIVLEAAVPTKLECPYRNPEVKVCRLGPQGSSQAAGERAGPSVPVQIQIPGKSYEYREPRRSDSP